jgi:hypothetical protein
VGQLKEAKIKYKIDCGSQRFTLRRELLEHQIKERVFQLQQVKKAIEQRRGLTPPFPVHDTLVCSKTTEERVLAQTELCQLQEKRTKRNQVVFKLWSDISFVDSICNTGGCPPQRIGMRFQHYV